MYHYKIKNKNKMTLLEKVGIAFMILNVVYFTLFFTGILHNAIIPFIGGK